jgi:sortase A
MVNIMKWLALLLIIGGTSLIGFGVYAIWDTSQKTDVALEEAEELLRNYNEQNSNLLTGDKENKDEEVTEVAAQNYVHRNEFNPVHGETVGILEIPALDAKLPIVEGTNEDELSRGVGHFYTSKYPTDNDQIVLSGHRDTVFRDIGKLEIGDTFIVRLPYGEFTYEIYETEIVDKYNQDVIQSTAPNEELVLSTCYPFSYVGSAPDRYIVYAKPVY